MSRRGGSRRRDALGPAGPVTSAGPVTPVITAAPAEVTPR
jgi:hypothetical protein